MRKKMAAGAAAAAVVMAVLLAARTANDHESGDIKEFTAFFDVSENEINEGNEIMELIAQKIGARCREQWLVGKSAEDAIAGFIASGEYTDFI